jgi:hypothetical protein
MLARRSPNIFCFKHDTSPATSAEAMRCFTMVAAAAATAVLGTATATAQVVCNLRQLQCLGGSYFLQDASNALHERHLAAQAIHNLAPRVRYGATHRCYDQSLIKNNSALYLQRNNVFNVAPAPCAQQ